jgi:hypothetical protein
MSSLKNSKGSMMRETGFSRAEIENSVEMDVETRNKQKKLLELITKKKSNNPSIGGAASKP